MDTPRELRTGASGWNYGGWRGRFYPEELACRGCRHYYDSWFDTVQVNYSFYRLPRPATYRKWAEQTPDGFPFAVKASCHITHPQRLEGIEKDLETFLENAAALGNKLGPILLQFPPSLRVGQEVLRRGVRKAQNNPLARRWTGILEARPMFVRRPARP